MEERHADLVQELSIAGIPISLSRQRALDPAVCCLVEWEGHWIESPQADQLCIGGECAHSELKRTSTSALRISWA